MYFFFKFSDAKLEQNQVAGFLTLLRHMLQTSSTNRDTFTRINGAATIGAILQKVSQSLTLAVVRWPTASEN
jgi:hypothetical protein